ncbi:MULTISPECIES: chemotaxis-specific protein-glutamate methyltransferase CheB [unclassified Undibacterium]|uniref:chemotaxis-specific protein-glutamate methyltransferase CheB n=1 Tax=unclassified Undibacterium TaxID=2630295 RepID=UPI002AC9B1E0|nr:MULTISPECIES: chemotaxis-specific protein-glutamate methyltransferase CheB [unclassified Undibacterium]MEB0140153.1 chemotaxis-specific protein-glutamate methyltransferase CheB [Undibacterium sp. CCC2.1]MEB0172473.1 chemotaxis-specific protein-glutamate methyltransferase CheB [Undibacterium sp. CCC1.1]MEB0176991.1 chemotaxis-specific protein-glutamate methyltransferase CheB [Undibacterium sp. CCC3.4]MEB0215595.1 chemotaxis-specific protein-glutamate methyltransferase CheB [Undibacterium sp. 
MIKLLIVDDSALMRRQLATLFNDEGGFEVRLARNGSEGVQENRDFQPDVITLDINMPEMDGLTALSIMMTERPVAVVMFSSLTAKGALATFEALNLGAVDYIVKPGGTISLSIEDVREQIIAKVRVAAKARLKSSKALASAAPAPRSVAKAAPARMPDSRLSPTSEGVVIVGVSTGGPSTLERILPDLSADFPWPILIAQHMPASFTLSFSQRINEMCALHVVEVNRPMSLEAGTVYIAKGGADMVLVRRAGKLMVIAKPESSAYLWHPSVEVLGRSALDHLTPKQIVGVMLTGMGNDGAEAFTAIKNQGGRTIAESEESSVVFGMPGELIKRGGATVTLHAEKIASQMTAWLAY